MRLPWTAISSPEEKYKTCLWQDHETEGCCLENTRKTSPEESSFLWGLPLWGDGGGGGRSLEKRRVPGSRPRNSVWEEWKEWGLRMAEAVKEGDNGLCRKQGPAMHSPLQSPRSGYSLRQVSAASGLQVQGCPGTDSQALPGLCHHPGVVRGQGHGRRRHRGSRAESQHTGQGWGDRLPCGTSSLNWSWLEWRQGWSSRVVSDLANLMILHPVWGANREKRLLSSGRSMTSKLFFPLIFAFSPRPGPQSGRPWKLGSVKSKRPEMSVFISKAWTDLFITPALTT